MFANEQPINDDEIAPIASSLFRAVRVSERPIPSVPRIPCELNEQPTIEIDGEVPRPGKSDVSKTPRISPTSFKIEHFFTTTDDSVAFFSNVESEIRIGLVHGDTSILHSEIVSMPLNTIASLDNLASFLCCLPSAELSISEKLIHFNDRVELANENMDLSTWPVKHRPVEVASSSPATGLLFGS
ncbi:hypothetical protein BLNAU_6902 [Blattamonas nauphoetae]|uniref:Uncharacterized protein n=1 Tax=Blattamonas nauphoetae TaxID=2049346 RepID=A0ABQ9Y377_9EUKA|nr:hypothetical protein BLNAU_6902 [Blattamonas nauphoetae]